MQFPRKKKKKKNLVTNIKPDISKISKQQFISGTAKQESIQENNKKKKKNPFRKSLIMRDLEQKTSITKYKVETTLTYRSLHDNTVASSLLYLSDSGVQVQTHGKQP